VNPFLNFVHTARHVLGLKKNEKMEKEKKIEKKKDFSFD